MIIQKIAHKKEKNGRVQWAALCCPHRRKSKRQKLLDRKNVLCIVNKCSNKVKINDEKKRVSSHRIVPEIRVFLLQGKLCKVVKTQHIFRCVGDEERLLQIVTGGTRIYCLHLHILEGFSVQFTKPKMSVTEARIQELDRSFLEFMSKSENVESATKDIYEDLLDEVLMGFVFDVHRTIKTGSSDVEEGIPDDESYAIVDSPGLDVFGQHPVKKSQECNCPNCDRGVAACRFATHLEKCMGMGRNSSRIASRRIANSTKDMSNFSGAISDDDDDVDWSLSNDKRKRRKDRNGIKRSKQQKSSQRNGDTPSESVHTSNENSPSNYDNMSIEDKRTLLTQICGVISEHTKKLCTRSMRCPQHTEDQRKEMRANLETTEGGRANQDNLHVDVDAYDENDGQNLREALARWDRDGSNHSSPADSTSTTSTSSISRKRDPKSKGKGKASKRDRGSPISQGD